MAIPVKALTQIGTWHLEKKNIVLYCRKSEKIFQRVKNEIEMQNQVKICLLGGGGVGLFY